MSATSYRTVARDAVAEIEVKRSRFRCTLARVATEADARALVERLRTEHWDARHHCSAFVVGPPPQPIERSSDDGEPAGTAGAPMLEVLRGAADGAGVSDAAAVVSRWFGGTLLGAGGLVRAYGDAVRAALDEAGTIRRELQRELVVDVDHADAGRVESALRDDGVIVLDQLYGARVTLRLGVPVAREGALRARLAELTAGAAAPQGAGERWVDRRERR